LRPRSASARSRSQEETKVLIVAVPLLPVAADRVNALEPLIHIGHDPDRGRRVEVETAPKSA